MPSDAEKQKRWLRAIFMIGFATGYSMCAKEYLDLSDKEIADIAHPAAQETYQRWGLTPDELRAAQAYAIELHAADTSEE